MVKKEKMAGKIVLEVPENLYDLYKINFPNVKVVKETDEPYKDYDYSAASMDILYGMNMGIDNIPNSKGWLDVPPNLIENFEFSLVALYIRNRLFGLPIYLLNLLNSFKRDRYIYFLLL